jgi:hypothetical protein
MNPLYRPCIPYIWIMLDNLKRKGLIGSPRYQKTTYPVKKPSNSYWDGVRACYVEKTP